MILEMYTLFYNYGSIYFPEDQISRAASEVTQGVFNKSGSGVCRFKILETSVLSIEPVCVKLVLSWTVEITDTSSTEGVA